MNYNSVCNILFLDLFTIYIFIKINLLFIVSVDHLTTGSNFHLALQNYLKTNIVPDDSSSIIDLWKSVTNVLNDTKLKPELIEQSLVHPILKYKGIVDCVSTIR